MLPISSAAGIATPFHSAIFTSTSAVCVTGLVVLDTGSYWSPLGQAMILLLIQIGGLGVVTAAVSFALLAGRKISLMQRSTYAGCYFSAKARRDSPSDKVCFEGYAFYRTNRRSMYAPVVLR